VLRSQSLAWQWSIQESLHIDPAPQDVGFLTRRRKAPRSEPLAALSNVLCRILDLKFPEFPTSRRSGE
jgi:hypothetical protein